MKRDRECCVLLIRSGSDDLICSEWLVTSGEEVLAELPEELRDLEWL